MKEEIIELLKSNKNLILTGAPGTGKTYLAKEIAREMTKVAIAKNPNDIIKDYYDKNKEELEKFYEESEKLRKEFIKKFPKENLKSISIDNYCLGQPNKDAFCNWIEYKLEKSGKFFPGNAKVYLLYYDKIGNLQNTTGKDNNMLIKEIGEALYKMATEKVYNGDLKFGGDKTTTRFAMKIYNSYNSDYYFPIYSTDYDKLCEIFNIAKVNDVYQQNLKIKEYFENNFKYIKPVIIKEIIKKFDLIDDDKDNDKYNDKIGFVQFHPSYDYTDFVEGLRPKKDENGNIVFERKDGVFKKFCKKALKNLIDSKKDIDTLNYEEIVKKYLINFYNDIKASIKDKKKFEIIGIGKKEVAPIKGIDINYNKNNEEELKFTVETDNATKLSVIKELDLMVDYYKKFVSKKPEVWKLKAFIEALNITSLHTYIYGFLKAFYDKYNDKIENDKKQAGKNNITVQKVEEKDFVFIIDEINRGEISKIFGELFFSIDSGYRGEKGKVKTQYDNLIEDGDEFKDGFYIPENVYIIGTMNDIDRSVESMDFAMRRRFAWKEIKAKDTQDSILGELVDLKDEAIKRMDKLNEAISSIPELSDDYNIGASYFLKLDNYYNGNNKDEAFKKLWENHLKGLLFEYTRGMPNQKEIMEKFKNAYNN